MIEFYEKINEISVHNNCTIDENGEVLRLLFYKYKLFFC